MKRWFRHSLEALETIASSLLELRRSIAEALAVKGDGDSISERVATLELGRGLFEADMESRRRAWLPP